MNAAARDSVTYRMVSWLHGRGPQGATMNEVAAQFGLDTTLAHGLMSSISRRNYCDVTLDDSVRPRRYIVTRVDKDPRRNGIARPVKGVHPKGMVVQFSSITAAETEGGFCTRGIGHVLNGRQRTHAGYIWSYQEIEQQEAV